MPVGSGQQIVGTVPALGAGITRFAVGDRVGVPYLGGPAALRGPGRCSRLVLADRQDRARRGAHDALGGVITSFVLELLIYPVIFAVWKGWRLSHHEGKPPTAIVRT